MEMQPLRERVRKVVPDILGVIKAGTTYGAARLLAGKHRDSARKNIPPCDAISEVARDCRR
jgi:hypothetical protein